jgi:hypothetical protein
MQIPSLPILIKQATNSLFRWTTSAFFDVRNSLYIVDIHQSKWYIYMAFGEYGPVAQVVRARP